MGSFIAYLGRAQLLSPHLGVSSIEDKSQLFRLGPIYLLPPRNYLKE